MTANGVHKLRKKRKRTTQICESWNVTAYQLRVMVPGKAGIYTAQGARLSRMKRDRSMQALRLLIPGDKIITTFSNPGFQAQYARCMSSDRSIASVTHGFGGSFRFGTCLCSGA